MGIRQDVTGVLSRGFRGYFNFKGTASRRDFWIWMGFFVVASNVDEVLYWLLIVPTIAYGVRRMHDVDKSGWWWLVWPILLIFALQRSRTGVVSPFSPIAGRDRSFTRPTDARSLSKTVTSWVEAARIKVADWFMRSEGSTEAISSAGSFPPPAAGVVPLGTRPHSSERTESPKFPRHEKPVGPTDLEVFSEVAVSLGIATASDESAIAIVQSLIRQVWSQIHTQNEVDPTYVDHIKLALRALAVYSREGHELASRDSVEKAQALMWYGILLAMVSTEDRPPTNLGDHAKLSSADALREARRIFEANDVKKVAGRCMEELGQYGRLLGRSDYVTEGFNGAVALFESAGATERARQAQTNAGPNFQRHSSAFFDGGQHSLKATTILGSVQGERLRAALHHLY